MKQVAFITGGTKNSGFAIAEKFASEGYDVAITSRNQNDANEKALILSEKYHIKARGYEMQLNSVSSVRNIFSQFKNDFDRLDVLCLVAGHLAINYLTENTDEEMFHDVIETNVTGNFFCCQEATSIMKKNNHGSIVVLGSVHSLKATQDRVVYTISKGALLSMTKGMALDLGRYGIRANYIAAGAIRTDRWDGKDEKWLSDTRGRYPIGKESSVEDIANAAFYLGSDLSSTVTGAELTVDSGISACLVQYKKPE